MQYLRKVVIPVVLLEQGIHYVGSLKRRWPAARKTTPTDLPEIFGNGHSLEIPSELFSLRNKLPSGVLCSTRARKLWAKKGSFHPKSKLLWSYAYNSPERIA